MITAIIITSLSILTFGTKAFGYQEFVRHGYFSCISCHLSPAGGGILTEYGRSYGAEKLTRSASKDEEKPFHGLAPEMPSWLMLGGNIRQVQTATKTATTHDGRWIAMQRDIDVCAKGGPVTACVTGGIVRRAEQEASGQTRYGIRKALVQFQSQTQTGESLITRAGKFSPRYGLMIADHTSFIKQSLGFGLGDEQNQVDATWTTEKFEIAGSYIFDRVPGMTLNAMIPVKETMQVGMSYRSQNAPDFTTHTDGLFAGLGFSDATYLLAEVDRQTTALDAGPQELPRTSTTWVTYTKLGHEVSRGIVTYVQHQVEFKESAGNTQRRDSFGLGIQVFPRPHFEIDAYYGRIVNQKNMTYMNMAYILLHYYI